MDYKVSVIVPVYNAETYLDICVRSLLSQTLTSLEIILVDDGSSDNSGNICDEFARNYANVSTFHLENGGPSRARNFGIKKARGKFIGFVDADDYIVPEMFSTLLNGAENNVADIVMCGYSIDDENGIHQLKMNYKQEYVGEEEIRNGLLALYSKRYHSGLYSVCNKLFSKNLLQQNQIVFDIELIRAEDAWFVFECLKVARKVRIIDKSLYYYRQVSTSTMHMIQSDRYERSKAFRIKLQKEDELLGIEIDYNEFFYEFLYEGFIYCRAMLQQNDVMAVRKVLNDDFFKNACQYSRYLPPHLKVMCCMERKSYEWGLMKILQIWALK